MEFDWKNKQLLTTKVATSTTAQEKEAKWKAQGNGVIKRLPWTRTIKAAFKMVDVKSYCLLLIGWHCNLINTHKKLKVLFPFIYVICDIKKKKIFKYYNMKNVSQFIFDIMKMNYNS